MEGSKGGGGAVWAVGLMSGTSLDGIDAAVVLTDGEHVLATGPALTHPYEPALRARLFGLKGKDPVGNPVADEVAREMTLAHAVAVRELLAEWGESPEAVHVIGFHGQTVLHRPGQGITRQIGDPGLLAAETGIDVVFELRLGDVAAGGEGAPIAPAFHRALAEPLVKPLAVLNLGGVGNVTWISPDGGLAAFDTGPGNAMINDWATRHGFGTMDAGGALARRGTVDEPTLSALLAHPYFRRDFPKSLDRDDFTAEACEHLSAADGAATLTAFSAAAVAKALDILPAPPVLWLVTGGGRHNPVLMAELRKRLNADVEPVEVAGWHGDALEAQAFAYLAVRSLKGLPLTYPSTTGVPSPATGGRLYPVG